jgi:molybdenum cofactor cytidylyltransferase
MTEDDVRLLVTEGLGRVWVTELEPGEVAEDQAVARAASELACGALDIRLAVGGRANIFATETCCTLVDDELLRQVNCAASIMIATVPNFSYHSAGARIATIKCAPFAVPAEQLETVVSILRERGPVLQARPIRTPKVAVLFSDPVDGSRARELYEHVVRQRLEKWHASVVATHAVAEKEVPVSEGLERLLAAEPSTVLVASSTTPAGPDDAVGLGMRRAGCHIERFLAPVEPGNLFLMGYKEDTPIVSAPGCHRSLKLNVLDLILPPLLARYRVSGWEVACLGHGGLLG